MIRRPRHKKRKPAPPELKSLPTPEPELPMPSSKPEKLSLRLLDLHNRKKLLEERAADKTASVTRRHQKVLDPVKEKMEKLEAEFEGKIAPLREQAQKIIAVANADIENAVHDIREELQEIDEDIRYVIGEQLQMRADEDGVEDLDIRSILGLPDEEEEAEEDEEDDAEAEPDSEKA